VVVEEFPMSGEQPVEDGDLVRRARTEPAAFGELCRRYSSPLYSYLRARTNNDEDAADLTQQVFLKAMYAFPRYRERGRPFGAWLFRIARNLLTDSRRRQRPSVSWDDVPEAHVPRTKDDLEAQVVAAEAHARVRAALGRLDATQREIVLLRFVAGLTFREIGAVVGKSESSAHRDTLRALRTLQEQYHDQ